MLRRSLQLALCVLFVAAVIALPVLVVSPPYAIVQTVTRNFMVPMITGERSKQLFAHSGVVYFTVVLLPVVAAAILSYRRMMASVPPGSYVGRAAKWFGVLVAVTVVLNAGVQGGIGIPLALAYAALLLAFWWQALSLVGIRRGVEAVIWIGTGFLLSSACLIPLLTGGARFDLQRLHGLYGYLWVAAIGAYLIIHIVYYDAKRETGPRNRGYVAALALAATILTGIARLHAGGETYASGLWPHLIAALVLLIAAALHVGESWRRRGFAWAGGPASTTGQFIITCTGVGALLPSLVLLLGTTSHVLENQDAVLATPVIGVTASGPIHSTLSSDVVGVEESDLSCGKTVGCHIDIHAQWERSAHHLAANPAYRQTVRLLVEEQGTEAARLCAGCHDPVPLLSGRIVAGSGYPFDQSEGVTCVVCHSMQPGWQGNNGHYVVNPSSTFHDAVKDPFTAYMMVALYRRDHREEHLAPDLKANNICAPCHSLTTAHLTLRETFEEWRDGPFGPGKDGAKTCAGCHMPRLGESYLSFPLHDHRTPGANVALAQLRGESGEVESAFIAAALDLQVVMDKPEAACLPIRVRLTNQNGAHGFPTAPRDLLEYWLEARFEGQGGESSWRRLGEGGLFDERLSGDSGQLLNRHEIWRAYKREGPEGIAPQQSREFSYRLELPAGDPERLTLRLMHRRYHSGFLDFLGVQKGDLYTEAVEIMRRTEPLAPG